MESARHRILSKLREAQRPFEEVEDERRPLHPVAPVTDVGPDALRARFIDEVQTLQGSIHEVVGMQGVMARLAELLEGDDRVISWDALQMPVADWAAMMAGLGIRQANVRDAGVRVGITGVDAALASTGSLVLVGGPGKPRSASLLPPVHIALLPVDHLYPNLESWWAAAKMAGSKWIRQSSQIAIVSGPSRTADIAMELVLGMHGPRELHVILF